MKFLFLILLALGCNSGVSNNTPADPVKVPEVTAPEVQVQVPGTIKIWKTPAISLPTSSSKAMLEASQYIDQHGNTDEFYNYVRANAKKLEGGNETSLENGILKLRECFDKGETVKISWGWYLPGSAAIGGWNGIEIKQNSKKNLTSIERAAHWMHEISHKCGFSHVSNNISRYPIIANSWPYQVGELFEQYLKIKTAK